MTALAVSVLSLLVFLFWLFGWVESTLPPIRTVADYQPKLITEVFDRNGKKIAEFFRERRRLVSLDEVPEIVKKAFIAAEDGEFYQHKGINWLAVLRAFWANVKAGDKVQGASTITQQLVKTLFLTPEKTFERKFKEMLLAQKLEQNMTKDEILYLYLNQIFFGQNSYGIAIAAETYFRKKVGDLSLAEAALLAGLPKAPSKFNPLKNPSRAKERQIYVLRRMFELGFISEQQMKAAANLPLKIYLRESFVPQAHYPVEAARILLLRSIPEEDLITKGYQIHLTIDLALQIRSSTQLSKHLEELDRRQGFRGPKDHIPDPGGQESFLRKTVETLAEKRANFKILKPDGQFEALDSFNPDYNLKRDGLPAYLKIGEVYPALVTEVDDKMGWVEVRVGEVKGLMDIESHRWARKFDPTTRGSLNRWSDVLKPGDVIDVRIIQVPVPPDKKLAWLKKNRNQRDDFDQKIYVHLYQEPQVQGAVLVIDHLEGATLAMVGGYDFLKSPFNRVLQARRQTGSAFKALVYAAALDKNYHPFSTLLDTPLVYENQKQGPMDEWRPANYGKDFQGEITFRNALIRSLNVPSVRLIEDLGISWVHTYVRRLGFFSPLNLDFTLVLGSSSVTLYEMTRAFSVFANQGRKVVPSFVKEVVHQGAGLPGSHLTLDDWFAPDSVSIQESWESQRQNFLSQRNAKMGDTALAVESKIFFDDPNQWISPQTAYIITDILRGVIRDPNGTAARFSGELPQVELAGKTGSTNDYVDGWFLGYSPQYTVGVWVGFDEEKTLGPGEVGGRTALPIWMDIMKALYEGEEKAITFPVPEGVEFVDLDYYTGKPWKKGQRLWKAALRSEDREALEEWGQIRIFNDPEDQKREFDE